VRDSALGEFPAGKVPEMGLIELAIAHLFIRERENVLESVMKLSAIISAALIEYTLKFARLDLRAPVVDQKTMRE
jgi:hypothetical protein